MAFPSNQFFKQEPKSNAEIKEFVRTRFGVTFPMYSKVDVNGSNTHPLFAYLRYNSSLYDKRVNKVAEIQWNFGKFLLDSEGKVITYFDPQASFRSIKGRIVELLENN